MSSPASGAGQPDIQHSSKSSIHIQPERESEREREIWGEGREAEELVEEGGDTGQGLWNDI